MLMIPLVAACLLAYLLAVGQLRAAGTKAPYREALLWSVTGLGVYVFLCTESLGALKVLTPLGLAASWTMLSIGLAAAAYRVRAHLMPPGPAQLPAGLPIRITVCGIGVILGITGLIALLAPPNTWDSMTYHMPRVMHWAQNRSVDFYPTHIPRQLQYFPWAEYAILQPQLLSATDRFANLVQWISSLVSMTGVSLIAGFFTTRKLPQALAAIVCGALPMGIMQSTSTQNDYVGAAWLICFTFFMLCWSNLRRGGLHFTIAAGCALGLGMLTKPTLVCFFPAVFLWAWVRRDGYKDPLRLIPPAATVGLLAMLFCGAHFWRLSTFPLPTSGVVSNAEFSPQIVMSNILRGITLHTNTPWQAVNRTQAQAIRWALAGIGIAEADPRNTWEPDTTYYAVFPLRMHEDHAGNGLHLLLSVFAFGACCLLARKHRKAREVLPYGLSLLAGLITFWILFRWQPWASRLQLPLFVLATPFMAVVFGWFGRKTVTALSIALILMAIPHLIWNESRPLTGARSIVSGSRRDVMFNNRPELAGDYQKVTQAAINAGCQRIGLAIGGDTWEYPIWTLLDTATSIRHVGVANGTEIYPELSEPPCAVIADHGEERLAIGQQTFKLAAATESLRLYLP
jgi:dolichyl-phosphate-mannose-protein mannosyltransferase